jgi:hypothetical protein
MIIFDAHLKYCDNTVACARQYIRLCAAVLSPVREITFACMRR